MRVTYEGRSPGALNDHNSTPLECGARSPADRSAAIGNGFNLDIPRVLAAGAPPNLTIARHLFEYRTERTFGNAIRIETPHVSESTRESGGLSDDHYHHLRACQFRTIEQQVTARGAVLYVLDIGTDSDPDNSMHLKFVYEKRLPMVGGIAVRRLSVADVIDKEFGSVSIKNPKFEEETCGP